MFRNVKKVSIIEYLKGTLKLNMWEGMDFDVERYLNSGFLSFVDVWMCADAWGKDLEEYTLKH